MTRCEVCAEQSRQGARTHLDAQIANRNRSDVKSQSASEIATKIAFESVEKRVEIATEIALIRIDAISNRRRVGFEIAGDHGI